MRALLIVNPFATSTTDAGRDALAHTLSARCDLTVELTTHRGHAGEIAAGAAGRGFEVVIVHGGDGTVNEVVNGLIGPPGSAHGDVAVDGVPALAVVPGGSANVFARSLGILPDPLQATGQLITLLSVRARRRISLGHVDDRWYLFNAGMGVDAEVVHSIEDQRRAGKPASDARYIVTTVAHFLKGSRRQPRLTVSTPAPDGGRRVVEDVQFVFVSNANPWTFIGDRPVWTNPDTDFDTGLGLFAARSMKVRKILPLAAQLLLGIAPRVGHLVRDDDVASVRIEASEPTDLQMDGDYIGERTLAEFGCVPDRLEVVAPPLDSGSR
ncbi:diacylglycerol/lipid kinase family protein [Williamsia deligens]|uniref:Diacylglycerol/lipid kinase family protein n=1 Tax=Williamsia deligens TaxID=321325 RepID=A0ABW3G6E8_9NOCA|nr:diacylglycerol kinase family protein [Williamsia deligens]MCP2194814.1 Diacylglycerol kinase family enzyme [Williamsia deligens]